ncbi:MAG: DNA-directed RNA polymerase subunit omega [Clostridia bacterium]|nr:DNA-directed RNA polymerase subunit omega [Clostridia bacterium]MBR2053137.1 DNA-directed RNA polymerase subunit omega [Clostridia bacterium]MBR2221200.1 DNA-directed RNA polymerase subunit omega [Clostridia bacterium]MBR2433668.1 DNA-directed RNA polymerase subunit omega [Clostridia bacterium]MBR3790464.1 DNA-directed RNA polymerase subunit omega [Clostridia bacterium]
MMIDPPIDVLAKKTDNNKYKLCNLLAKRAKELQIRIPDEIEASEKKAISIAADEIMNGDVIPSDHA